MPIPLFGNELLVGALLVETYDECDVLPKVDSDDDDPATTSDLCTRIGSVNWISVCVWVGCPGVWD